MRVGIAEKELFYHLLLLFTITYAILANEFNGSGPVRNGRF